MDDDNDQILRTQDLGPSSCTLSCRCPSEFAVRVGNGPVRGELNIPAFLVHIFCVSCKIEIPLRFDLDEATDESGTTAMTFTGECPNCGKDVDCTVGHHDTDVPHSGGPITLEEYARERQHEEENQTTAERLAKMMSRKRGLI